MSPNRRPTTLPSLIALAAMLVAASLGLAACGGSSSTATTTQTTANAAATGTTTGTTTTGTTTTGTTTTGTTTTGTSPSGKNASGGASTGTSSTGTSSTGATTTPGGSTTGTTHASRAARIAAVHTCLTKKGITLGSGGIRGAHLPKGMTRAQLLEAFESCGRGLGGNRFGKGGFKHGVDSARYRAVLARFAACLRQNGIKIGEPNTSGNGPTFDTKGINTGSPQFKAAVTSCRSTLQGALTAHPGASKAS
jgi:hypothetical protein